MNDLFEGKTLVDWQARPVRAAGTVVLIGCGAEKMDCPAPARQLYTGPLFRDSLAYAESCGHPWGIISGLHGFLPPDRVVEPYDYRLGPAPKNMVDSWATFARYCVRSEFGRPDLVVLLMGGDYADRLEKAWAEWGIPCQQPLKGMGIGDRRKWLRQQQERS